MVFAKWQCYFQLKRKLYESYAYAYLGEMLLAEDKCGEGIKACQEGIKAYEETNALCKKYADAKGPGMQFCFIPITKYHLKDFLPNQNNIYSSGRWSHSSVGIWKRPNARIP